MADIYDALIAQGVMTEEEAAIKRKEAAAAATPEAEKPKKSGVYTSTQISSNIPPASTLADYINTIFQKYKGRDANLAELTTWLPELTKQYKSAKGKSKSTIKYTYKNGELISTDYLTANAEDPRLWIEDKVKQDVEAHCKIYLGYQI
jgi:hypothetical protein